MEIYEVHESTGFDLYSGSVVRGRFASREEADEAAHMLGELARVVPVRLDTLVGFRARHFETVTRRR